MKIAKGIVATIRRAPIEVQKILFSPIWIAYHLKDYRSVKQFKEQNLAYENMSFEKKQAVQFEKLQKLVNYAYEHVKFYRRYWDTHGFHPDDLKTISDINKIPIINKDIVRDNVADFISDQANREELIEHKTGGSTGIPLVFYYNAEADYYRALAVERWKLQGGVTNVFEKSCIVFRSPESLLNNEKIWSRGTKYYGAYGMFRNELILSANNMYPHVLEQYIKKMKAFKPSYIHGYASAVYMIADHMRQDNIKIPVKTVLTSSDCLTRQMRETIEDVFCCKVFDRYGLGEEAASAVECDVHDGYHIDMDKCVIQVVDENDNELETTSGRIIGTGLCNYAMPFIRYDTGDVGKITNSPCKCGRKTPRLYELEGRGKDVIVLPSGKKISPAWLDQAMPIQFADCISESQFEQIDKYNLTIHIVLRQSVIKEEFEKSGIIEAMEHLFDNELKIKLRFHSVLPRGDGGKLRRIVSRL